MDYGQKKVADLKIELKNRGAKLTGTKEKLIERLHDYDRNNNFKIHENNNYNLSARIHFMIEWPEEKNYKSVDLKTVLPNFDIININSYFLELYKEGIGMSDYSAVHIRGYNMLQNNYLLALVTVNTSTHIFFKGQVHSENTKSLTYFASITICNESGCIIQSVCECVAGKGPKAICKHVSVLCYAILKFREQNIWQIKLTPTQNKQVWHAPKKNKLDVSPQKAENLSYQVLEYNVSKKKKRSMCYDPRPQSSISLGKEWAATVRNKVINYCSSSQTRIGLCGILDSANMQDVVHDHDYLPFPLHHQLILNKISVTTASAKEIEKKTKNQTKTKLWYTERSFRVTASRVGEICKFTVKKDQEKYAQSLICDKKIVSTALEWGKSMETTAIEAYEGKTGKKVERCGLHVSVQYPFIGASPDGLIDDHKILEIKCPYSIKDQMIGPNNYSHLEHNSEYLQLKETSNYYYQIQTQLLVAGRDCCDLFIWTNTDEKVINVKKNDSFIQNIIIPRVKDFYFKFMLPKIAKNMYDC